MNSRKRLQQHRIASEAAAALWAFRDCASVAVKVKRTELTPFSPQACTLTLYGETIARYSAGEIVVGIPAAITTDQIRFKRAIRLVQCIVGYCDGIAVIVRYDKQGGRTGVRINGTSILEGHTAALYKRAGVLILQGEDDE